MKRFPQILLAASALALAVTVLAQSGPATNRPAPPAPPRPDAPGTPINPQQNNTPEAAAPAAPDAAPATTPTSEPVASSTAASTAPRALVFAEADIDKDRRVSIHEYTTYVENRMASRSTQTVHEETIQRFLDLDQDSDAYLSEAEASAPPPVQPSAPPPAPPRR